MAAEQPHAPDQRNRGDFVEQKATERFPDLCNLYSRWQVMGTVGRQRGLPLLSLSRPMVQYRYERIAAG